MRWLLLANSYCHGLLLHGCHRPSEERFNQSLPAGTSPSGHNVSGWPYGRQRNNFRAAIRARTSANNASASTFVGLGAPSAVLFAGRPRLRGASAVATSGKLPACRHHGDIPKDGALVVHEGNPLVELNTIRGVGRV